MKANPIALLSFLSGEDKRFTIPVFQRNYDWKEEHCKQLFKDILNLINNPQRKTHFMGTVVYVSNSEFDMIDFHEYVLIDGQQRVTTLTLLLKALYDVINSSSEVEDKKIAARIYEHYLINKYADTQQKLRLKPMIEDDKIFQQIMDNDFETINKNANIFRNYQLFKKLIDNSSIDPKQIFEGVKRLTIVYIGLVRGEDNPQLIFESLNSTGLDLSEADLIRNFILMDKEPETQEFLFKKYWHKIETLLTSLQVSDFIRDYLTMKLNDIPKKEKVYLTFKKYVYESKQIDSIEELLEELLYFAKIYDRLINNSEKDKEIRAIIADLKKLKVTVSYPFLMEVYSDYLSEVIDRNTFIKVLSFIETYVFRRLVCEKPNNSLNKVFKSLAADLKEIGDYEDNYYENLCTVILQKRYSAAFPNDSEFRQEFNSRDMYKFKNIRYLLDKLENYNNKEKIELETLSVEHIMPQNLNSKWTIKLGTNAQQIHEKYVHNIGNLTLTGYNSEMSDKLFEEKKVLLKESRLKLNKGLFEIDNWNENEIQKRAVALFDLAQKVWPTPKIVKTLNINRLLDKEYLTIDDDFDVKGTKPKAFELFGERRPVNSWKQFIIEVSKTLYDLDSIIFRSFTTDNDFSGRTCRIISSVEDELRESYKIAEGIFIETHFNANYTLNYIKLMADKYEFEDEDLKYWIR